MNTLQASGPAGLYSSTPFAGQQQQPPPPPHSGTATASPNWNGVFEPAAGPSRNIIAENMQHHHFEAQQQQQAYPQQMCQGQGLPATSPAPYQHFNDNYGISGGRLPPHLLNSGSRGAPQAVDPNPNLYIHNVPKDATEDELRDLFSVFGTVERIRVKVNQKIGPQALYAFVTFKTTEEAQRALERLNGYEMRTRRLRIEFQRSRGDEDRGPVLPSGGSASNGGGAGISGPSYRDRSSSLGPNRGPRQSGMPAREFPGGLRPTERRKRMGFDASNDGGGPGGGGIGSMSGGGGPGPPSSYSEQLGCEVSRVGPVFKKPRFTDDSSYIPEHMNGSNSSASAAGFATNDVSGNGDHQYVGGSRPQLDVASQRQFYAAPSSSDMNIRGTPRGVPDYHSTSSEVPASSPNRFSESAEGSVNELGTTSENPVVVVYLCEILRRIIPALFASSNNRSDRSGADAQPASVCPATEVSRSSPNVINEFRPPSQANYYFNLQESQPQGKVTPHDGMSNDVNGAVAPGLPRQVGSVVPTPRPEPQPPQQLIIEDDRNPRGPASEGPSSSSPPIDVPMASMYLPGAARTDSGAEVGAFTNLGLPPPRLSGNAAGLVTTELASTPRITAAPSRVMGWPIIPAGVTTQAAGAAPNETAPVAPPFVASTVQRSIQQNNIGVFGSLNGSTPANIYSGHDMRLGASGTPPLGGHQSELGSSLAQSTMRSSSTEIQQPALVKPLAGQPGTAGGLSKAGTAPAPQKAGASPAGVDAVVADPSARGTVELQAGQVNAPPCRSPAAVRDPNGPKTTAFAEAVLARNSKRRVPVEFTKLDGEFERCVDQLRGSLLNIRHRSSYEDLARKPVVAVCLIQPSYVGLENVPNALERRQERYDCLMGHIQYLDSKQRAGVISTPNSPILYIVGPAAPIFETYTRRLRPPPPQGTVLGLFTTELAKEASVEQRTDLADDRQQD